MLSYSFQLDKEAEAVEGAILKALAAGYRTKDIQQPGAKLVGTVEMAEVVRNFIK
jgi:3-isopropylmalate dehydrogenase